MARQQRVDGRAKSYNTAAHIKGFDREGEDPIVLFLRHAQTFTRQAPMPARPFARADGFLLRRTPRIAVRPSPHR